MPADPNRVQAVFLAAIEYPDAISRAAFLEKECGSDASLRERIEQLLAAHREDSFLGTPIVARTIPGPQDTTSVFDPSSAKGDFQPDAATGTFVVTAPSQTNSTAVELGTVIAGRYTLVEVIGEGGMGSVYLASQTEPVKRHVALKLIKSGMDSKGVLARFDAERQALAVMDHPNIARIYDGGVTPSGQPYFVMELVRGSPLTEYCDSKRLSVPARLEHFVSVCHAVQHAHQKGIIHRDLKPGNVLVTEVDGRPTPKVIDFGVAKATEVMLTDMSFSDTGAIVGTPTYMSPEQADPATYDIDTRTDVYALGVMLYELLTGSAPIDAKQFKRGAIFEMLRMVREVDPPRPSTKLSASIGLPSIAANRNSEPAKLANSLRGDLDWVVMKALEKDRRRRYDTANGFAADIQRYLADEVVEARPPSSGYRFKKFVKRNKVQVLAGTLVLLTLVVGVVGTSLGMMEAEKQAKNAELREMDAVLARDAEKTANGKLMASEEDLKLVNTKLISMNDQLLSGLAKSLLRPLGVQIQPNHPLPPLNDQEIEPLWELASTRDDRLRIRFLEEAIRDPVTLRRIQGRSGVVLHATIGLDAVRRERVEEILGERLQTEGISLEEQEHLAYCLSQIGVRNDTLKVRVLSILIQAMSKTTDVKAMTNLSKAIPSIVNRLESRDATSVYRDMIATLSNAAGKLNNRIAIDGFRMSTSSVMARIAPDDAVRIVPHLIQTINVTVDQNVLQVLTECLASVMAKLEPKDASRLSQDLAPLLIQTMIKTTSSSTLHWLSHSLSAVIARMEAKEADSVAGEAASLLILIMSKTTNPSSQVSLSKNVSSFADRMETKNAIRVRGEAASILIQTMSKNTNKNQLLMLSMVLKEIVIKLPSKEIAGIAATLTEIMSKSNDPEVLATLSTTVGWLAIRLDPKETIRVSGQAALVLTQAMIKTTNPKALSTMSTGLSWVVRIDSEVATQIAGDFIKSMSGTSDPEIVGTLAWGLTCAATRLDNTSAASTLVQAMSKTSDPDSLLTLCKQLALVSAQIDPMIAKRVCEEAATILTQSMSKTVDVVALLTLSRCVSSVITGLDPTQAGRVSGVAATILTQAMSMEESLNGVEILSQSLSQIVAHLEPKLADEVAHSLIRMMSKTTRDVSLVALLRGVCSVVSRVQPRDARKLSGEAAAIFVEAMLKSTDRFALESLSGGLSNVLLRLDSKAASGVMIPITRALGNTSDPNVLGKLSKSLTSLVARIDGNEDGQVLEHASAALLQAMSKTTDRITLLILAQSVNSIADRLEPNKANHVHSEAGRLRGNPSAALAQEISRCKDPGELRRLFQQLYDMITYLEPKEATEILDQVIASTTDLDALVTVVEILIWASSLHKIENPERMSESVAKVYEHAFAKILKDMDTALNDKLLQHQAQTLLVMAPRLEFKNAGEIAVTLMQAMSKTTDPVVLRDLSRVLSLVLAGGSPKNVRSRCLNIVAACGLETCAGGLLASSILFQKAIEPPQPRLSAQVLVNLLKNPFCLGEMIKMVLSQLGRHYHRSFADHWEFLEYATMKSSALDLASPPMKPTNR